MIEHTFPTSSPWGDKLDYYLSVKQRGHDNIFVKDNGDIEIGSTIEVDGEVFVFEEDETPLDTSSSYPKYLEFEKLGTVPETISATWVDEEPTFDLSRYGLYNGNKRVSNWILESNMLSTISAVYSDITEPDDYYNSRLARGNTYHNGYLLTGDYWDDAFILFDWENNTIIDSWAPTLTDSPTYISKSPWDGKVCVLDGSGLFRLYDGWKGTLLDTLSVYKYDGCFFTGENEIVLWSDDGAEDIDIKVWDITGGEFALNTATYNYDIPGWSFPNLGCNPKTGDIYYAGRGWKDYFGQADSSKVMLRRYPSVAQMADGDEEWEEIIDLGDDYTSTVGTIYNGSTFLFPFEDNNGLHSMYKIDTEGIMAYKWGEYKINTNGVVLQ